ncbi:hypothetical protein BDN70DRAFT_889050 [Pholiota conissans]|uniref:DUF6697 domain-containing protein n=1 Tax=Pholiota conissans TaxID=109636 RepID=A0A9P5YJI7_9AGAR|nr:hypothetical protein BDN70DRAFT_889050 [Pholiota conissans]
MDELFWSSVVKRWSEASENVIKLKKELAILEEERSLYIHAFGPLSQLPRNEYTDWSQFEHPPKGISKHNKDSGTKSLYATGSAKIQDELQDAEIGLGKAKEEYRKLQHDLAVSAQTINALTLENERLIRSRHEEMDALHEHLLNAQRAFSSNTLTADDTPRQTPTWPESNQQEYTSAAGVERQLEILMQGLKANEEDKQELRHELESTRDKLHKAEETIKALLAATMKLQKIARHSAHNSSHPVSVHSLHSGSRRSSKISITSNHSHAGDLVNRHASRTIYPKSLDVVVSGLEVGGKTFVKQKTSQFLPLEREEATYNFPSVSDTISIVESENLFDRAFLKHILGEGASALNYHFSMKNELFDEKNTTLSYLCPTLDHHPWCPRIPGQHGYIFVGLGKDKDAYRAPVIRHLFVGLPKDQTKQRVFRYLGKYKVSGVEPLLPEEWCTLSKEIQHIYASLTREKGKDPRQLAEILFAYDKGNLRVPCIQLQCVSFDQSFYTALISHRKAGQKS